MELMDHETILADAIATKQFKVKIIKRVKELEFEKCPEESLEGVYGPVFADYARRFRILEDSIASDKIPTKDVTWFWVTINPAVDNFKRLQEVVDKVLSKKWLTEAYYQYEQRSTDPEKPSGFHVHMMIIRPEGKRPSEIKREILNTCKTVCGQPFNKTCPIKAKTDNQWEKYSNYLTGVKQESKMLTVKADTIWRLKEGLSPDPIKYSIFD